MTSEEIMRGVFLTAFASTVGLLAAEAEAADAPADAAPAE